MLLPGVCPVTIRPPHQQNVATTLPTVKMVAEVSKAVAVLSTALIIKMIKSKVTFYILYFLHHLVCIIMLCLVCELYVNNSKCLLDYYYTPRANARNYEINCYFMRTELLLMHYRKVQR